MPRLEKHRRLANLKRKRALREALLNLGGQNESEGEEEQQCAGREPDFGQEIPRPQDPSINTPEAALGQEAMIWEGTEDDFEAEILNEKELDQLRKRVQQDAWAFLTSNQQHAEHAMRPTRYNKAQPAPRTLRTHRAKARKAEEERKAKGFADIRDFFHKSSKKANPPSTDGEDEIEEITPPIESFSPAEMRDVGLSGHPRTDALAADYPSPNHIERRTPDIQTHQIQEEFVGRIEQERNEAEAEVFSAEVGVGELEPAEYTSFQSQPDENYDSDDSACTEETLCETEEPLPKDFQTDSPPNLETGDPLQLPSSPKPPAEHLPHKKLVNQPSKVHHSVPQDPHLLAQTVEALEGLSRDRAIDLIFRGRLVAMLAFVRLFLAIGPENGGWKKASLAAAVAAGGGPWVSRQLRRWVKAFMRNPDDLPINRYHNTHVSKISDEDFASEIHLHLQTKGKYVQAMDVVAYVGQPEVQEKWGLQRGITVRTARRWMNAMSYRYQREKNGQYKDGHEREDVVEYRQETFLPLVERLERRMWLRDKDGTIIQEPILAPGEVPLIEWKHDESTFYANDRRRTRWVHESEAPTPVRKGEGASIMVADFVSPEFGWCRSIDGTRSTRILFKAGKNRDGYFAAEDVQAQTNLMLDIFEERFPNGSAIAVLGFDNAPSHQRRALDALSARKMPKNTPKKPKNWFPSGEIKMRNGKHPNGSPQSLYFPDDHRNPMLAGQFKGMKVILEERGLLEESKLNAECTGFKCPPRAKGVPPQCCCRRVLFEQPDFKDQKSELIELVEKRGHIAYFFPKYHCELNFIEMCWGAAKAHYRVQPPTSTEAAMEANVVKALDSVPLEKMRRFSIRCSRFMDAYRKGLNGAQAAWANRKYHGHRTLPLRIMEELS